MVRHTAAAVDIFDSGDRQTVVLDDGSQVTADVVVLALGHLDALPDDSGAALAAFAKEHGLAYVPSGHTAEQDLSVLTPGTDVLVLGFGQAFTDLVALVTEGRGGSFAESGDGRLVYTPSGFEPVLHVGSRRGVPYRSKLPYRLQAPLAPLPHFLDDQTIAALLASPEPLDFFADVLPIVAKEVGWAYYHELFVAHPERTTMPWETFATKYDGARIGHEVDALVRAAVPDPDDHFDIAALDQPLADVQFIDHDALHSYVADHIAADVARRTDASVQRGPRGVHGDARDGRAVAEDRFSCHVTIAARGDQHLVAELLHVLREWSAARTPAPAARTRRRRARAVRGRGHARARRRRDRHVRRDELEPR